MKRARGDLAGGKRTGDLAQRGSERVENAALCWGSLCIREEVPGLKEKKALVRLRWRRFAAVKACSHEQTTRSGCGSRYSYSSLCRPFLTDSPRLPRRTTTKVAL